MNATCTMPAFQIYPKDWELREDFREMSDEDLGFFWRCLNHSWVNFGLPGELEQIAQCLRTDIRKVRRLWERVGHCFELINGKWMNPIQEQQRSAQQAYHESRAEAGRRGAIKRWGGEDTQSSSAVAKPIAEPIAKLWPASASASAITSTTAAEKSTGIVESPPETAAADPQTPCPNTHRLVASIFRDVTPEFISRLLSAAQRVCPDVGDEDLALAVRATFKPAKQKTAGLFLETVPAWLQNQPDRKPPTQANCLDQMGRVRPEARAGTW